MRITLVKSQKMQGLITKDLAQTRIYKNTLIISILIFCLVAILETVIGESSFVFAILPVIITIIFGMFAMSSFNLDEASKTDRYVKSFPGSAKQIVLCKYNFVVCVTIIGALIGFFLTMILSLFFIQSVSFNIPPINDTPNVLVISLIGVFGVCIIESIQIPLIYKFGAEKTRMQLPLIIIILIVILTLIVGGIFFWAEKFPFSFVNSPIPFLIFLALIVLGFNKSYKISCKFYSEKEF